MQVYGTAFDVDVKADKSPLTEADRQSHNIIEQALKKLTPDFPVLSEESKAVAYALRKSWNTFWLVDPLDGTKEFIKRNGDFTVNIALIQDGKVVAGVVYIPVTATGYVGISSDGAYKLTQGQVMVIQPKINSSNVISVVASRSHLSEETENYINTLRQSGKEVQFVSRGSSLKLCLVAEGEADVYPRFAPTMEWDTAAAQAVVEAAGKKVLSYPALTPLQYNKEDLLNPWFIVE